jgi:Calcium-dependent channel, 7TM region, putative phosphate
MHAAAERALLGVAAGIALPARAAAPYAAPAVHAVAPGNTYKAMFEATAMTSGLYFVVLINVLIAWVGILFYRYVILRQAGLLSPAELALLRKYPPIRVTHSYTPADTFVRGAPPMRWTGWRDFFAANDAHLSRDAQVYLLFQRACMATTAVCALVSSVVLLPSYWYGDALTSRGGAGKAVSLVAMLRSDRGVFERFTSHNLPTNSPLVLLQIPVVAVAASCIVVLHTLVRAATHDNRTLEEWLHAPPTPLLAAPEEVDADSAWSPAQRGWRPLPAQSMDAVEPLMPVNSPVNSCRALSVSPPVRGMSFPRMSMPAITPPFAGRRRYSSFLGSSPRSPAPAHVSQSGGSGRTGWTLFVRGLPRNIGSKRELYALLDAIYPDQIRSVELVCKGRMSEARLVRTLSSARNRLDYLHDTPELDSQQLEDPEAAGEGSGGDAANALVNFAAFEPPSSRNRLLRRLFGKRPTREALIADLIAEITILERDLASRKREPVQGFLGCAFVTVRSAEAAASIVHDFPTSSSSGGPRIFERRARRRGGDGGEEASIPRTLLSTLSSVSPHEADAPASPLSAGEVGSSELPSPKQGECFLAFLRPDALVHATLMLLPESVRERIAPPGFCDPPVAAAERLALESLLAGQRSGTAEVSRAATSRLRSMKAERAPKSGDIMWGNVGISFFERTCREVLVQIFVFAGLILFTSPVAMLTALRLVFAEVSLLSDMGNIGENATAVTTSTVPTVARAAWEDFSSEYSNRLALVDIGVDDNAAEDLSAELMNMLPTALTSNTLLRSVLLAYIPVLLLAVVFSVVPSILRVLSGLEGYPTYTDREMSVFRKTSFYYLMNAVLLPSLALNTASEFLEMVYKQSDGGSNVYNALPILQSLFSGDIAYFLCNYLVQLALTGSVFWLMRLPSSASMMIRRLLALTPLEAAEAKCTSIFDFPRHFSYSVAVMSMCLLFGFMAPVIWGFAFFYYVCKHAVDTYLIRYVHPRSHIDGRLPRLATTFVLVWTCVSQLALAVIFYLQGRVHAGIITALLCGLTLAACVSVGPHLGSRILGVIPRLRDILIRKFIVGPSDEHSWFAGHNATIRTSTSSSSSSIAEASEQDALLMPSNGRESVWLLNVPANLQRSGVAQELDLSDTDSDDGENSASASSAKFENCKNGLKVRYGAVAGE